MLKRLLTNYYLWLAAILLAGFLVRLYKINSPLADWHSWRQADTASTSRIFWQQGIDLLHPRYYDISTIQSGYLNPQGYRMVEFPVFNLLHVALAKMFSNLSFEAAGRLVSIASALVSALFIYLLGKRFIGQLGGIISAFFYLFLPYNIFFTRVVLPEPLATAFSLIGLWFFVLWLDKEKDFYLYFSGVWLALSLLIKPYYLVFLLPLLYLVVHKYGFKATLANGKLMIKLAVFLNLVALPFFLWRIWINQYPAGIPFFEWAFNGDKIRFRPAFWRWLFSERLAKLILGYWGLPLFFLGVIRKEAKEHFIGFYLLAMFVYVSLVATANVRHDYYQIFTVPAISLALGAGADLIFRGRVFSKTLSILAFVFLVLMTLGTGAYQVKEFYKINHPEIIIAGQAIQRLTPKEARVIAPYSGDTAFLYQTDRFGWPAVDTNFEKLIQERGADYYVTVTPEDKDSQLIAKNYQIIEKTTTYFIADLHQPLKQ